MKTLKNFILEYSTEEQFEKEIIKNFNKYYKLIEKEYIEIEKIISKNSSVYPDDIKYKLTNSGCFVADTPDTYLIQFLGPSKLIRYTIINRSNGWILNKKIRVRVNYNYNEGQYKRNYLEANMFAKNYGKELDLFYDYETFCEKADEIVKFIEWNKNNF